MTGQKPTIDDVAALAGVGRTTVSRVLNNGPNVRLEVRDKVQKAVAKLGYTVNVQARSLAGGSARQIALIQSSNLDREPNSYYHSALELGALRGCADSGYRLVTHTIDPESATLDLRLLSLFEEGRYSAVILTPPVSDNLNLVQRLSGRGFNVVCISAGEPIRPYASSVGIDDRKAGFEIAQHLLALGHRRFGFIRGLIGHMSAESRFDGFLDALTAQGLKVENAIVERGDFTFHSGITCTESILNAPDIPTAIICANDDMAAGALLTLHKRGFDIPGDISVTGFDDTPVSEIIWPPLTTMHQPIKEIGRRAVALAIKAINAPAGSHNPVHDDIDFHLIVRDTTAGSTDDRRLEALRNMSAG